MMVHIKNEAEQAFSTKLREDFASSARQGHSEEISGELKLSL